MSCKDFCLPEPNKVEMKKPDECDAKVIKYCEQKFNNIYTKLNVDQKYIFEQIISQKTKIHCIDGPGGSGKTFVYKTLKYYFISIKKKNLSMAWTGIASILLPKGITSHRTFRLPLDLSNIESAFLKLDSDKKRLRVADVIIWDEASMIPKKYFRWRF